MVVRINHVSSFDLVDRLVPYFDPRRKTLVNDQHILLTEVYGFVRTADVYNFIRHTGNTERCARLLTCLASWRNPTEPSDGLTFVKVLDNARSNPCLAAASRCDDQSVASFGPLYCFLLVFSQIHNFGNLPLRLLLHSRRRGLCRPHGRLRRHSLAAGGRGGTLDCVVAYFPSSSFRNA